ncbi:MAG: 50S ribosomal protein L6, partial [Promethearchaeota archaeon]
MVKVAFFRDELKIPEGVIVDVDDNNRITIKGPEGGPITKDFSHARGIKITLENNILKFVTNFPKGSTLALVKTIINII